MQNSQVSENSLYRLGVIGALHDEDYTSKNSFALVSCWKWKLNLECKKTFWADVSTFKLHGHLMKHDALNWSSGNTHIMIEKLLNLPGICIKLIWQ
jgi:hypothetical protein